MSEKEKVEKNDIQIVSVEASKNYAQYWHVFYKGKKAGKAYIKINNDQPSITIELNKPCRGFGIGRIALAEICQLSQFNEIFATIAKTNVASYRAALYAGFQPISDNVSRQLRLVWRRNCDPCDPYETLKQKVQSSLGDSLKKSCTECQVGDFVNELPNEKHWWKSRSLEQNTRFRTYRFPASGGHVEVLEFECVRYRMDLRSSAPTEHDGRRDDFVQLLIWKRVD